MLLLLGPIGLLILAYNALFGEVEDGEEAAAKRLRELSEAEAKRHKQRLEQIDKEKNARIKAADETIRALELEKDTLEAEGKASDAVTLKILEAELAKVEAVLEANQKKIESWTTYYENLAALRGQDEKEFKESLKAQGIDLEDLQKRANELIAENERTVQFAQNRITKFRREQHEKRVADAKKANAEEEKEAKKHEAEMLKIMQDAAKQREKEADDLFKKRMAILDRVNQFEREQRLDAFQIAMDDLRAQFDAELELIGDNNELKLQLQREFDAKMSEIKAEAAAADKELEDARIQAQFDQINSVVEGAGAAFEKLSEINAILDEISEMRKAKIQEDRDADLAALEKNKQKALSVEGQSAAKKAMIDHKFAMQEFKIRKQAAEAEDKIARRQFQRNKVLKLGEIAINTAAGVMQALGSFPPPASFIMAGVTGAIGIAQAAIVAAQKFKGSSGSIQPPSFTPPPAADGGVGGGGGSDAGTTGGGALQDDIITDLDDLEDSETKVVVSQVEINDTQDQMAKVDDIATLG